MDSEMFFAIYPFRIRNDNAGSTTKKIFPRKTELLKFAAEKRFS